MESHAESVKRAVAAALCEDVGPGDINAALIAPETLAEARVVTREAGIFCGKPWVEETCRQLDSSIELHWRVADGSAIAAGDTILTLRGPARGLLTAERTIINFMQLLSATATQARRFVDAIAGTGAVILDTRKTVPGLRSAQKYAVRVGGACNHRMGLFDAYLLKENHISASGGIASAVAQARRLAPRKEMEIQVEVENETQLAEALAAGVNRVLLDNHRLADLRTAVAHVRRRARERAGEGEGRAEKVTLEASGGITLANVAAIAHTGVDYISVGDLTKTIAALDLSMRIVSTTTCEPLRSPDASKP